MDEKSTTVGEVNQQKNRKVKREKNRKVKREKILCSAATLSDLYPSACLALEALPTSIHCKTPASRS